jgi:hypothetical protein
VHAVVEDLEDDFNKDARLLIIGLEELLHELLQYGEGGGYYGFKGSPILIQHELVVLNHSP